MAITEKIYYNLQTDIAYRSDQNTEIANDNLPEFVYKGQKQIQWQLLTSDSRDINGDFEDFDTQFSATDLTGSAAIDNNFNHYYDCLVSTAIVAATPITTILIKSLAGTPREAGRLKLTNSAGETETINYNGFSLTNSIYTFTLADTDYVAGNQTPTYSYDANDDCRYLELTITKDTLIDTTNKATGLYLINLDCDKLIYQTLVEGNEEISDCKLELTLINSSTEQVLIKRIPVKCFGKMDDDGGVGPAPTSGYYTIAEITALLLAKNSIVIDTPATITDDANTDISLGAAAAYRKFIVECSVESGSSFYQFQAHVNHDGSTCGLMLTNEQGDQEVFSEDNGFTITKDYNSGTPLLRFTLSGFGDSPKLIYSIIRKIAIGA